MIDVSKNGGRSTSTGYVTNYNSFMEQVSNADDQYYCSV